MAETISAERTDEHGAKEIMGFHREAGKRYWRRHV